jgi:hypothetical protein
VTINDAFSWNEFSQVKEWYEREVCNKRKCPKGNTRKRAATQSILQARLGRTSILMTYATVFKHSSWQ